MDGWMDVTSRILLGNVFGTWTAGGCLAENISLTNFGTELGRCCCDYVSSAQRRKSFRDFS